MWTYAHTKYEQMFVKTQMRWCASGLMADILIIMDNLTLRDKPEAVKANLVALGTYVCAWRKLHHLTAEALADRANVSRGTLRGIEQGTGAASAANLVA